MLWLLILVGKTVLPLKGTVCQLYKILLWALPWSGPMNLNSFQIRAMNKVEKSRLRANMCDPWHRRPHSRKPKKDIQGVQEKLCFFHISLQPLPRLHRCKRPIKLSKQCKCTVTPIGWQYFGQPITAQCWPRSGLKTLKILGKKTQIFLNTLYMISSEVH